MDKILAVHRWKDLPDYECLEGFDAVTAPLKLWRSRFAPDVAQRQVYDEARFRTEREAEKAGLVAGTLYRELGLSAWNVGAWSCWAGVDDQRLTKDPYGCMQVFVDSFRVAAPSSAQLVYKGISSPRSSVATGYRRLHDAALMAQFDAVCTRSIGTRPELIESGFAVRTFKYRHVTECYPELGVGWIDKRGDCWGSWVMSYGLLLDTKPSRVSFLLAKGARLQMRVGHPYHPPLTQCVKEL